MDPMMPFWVELARTRHAELLREAERARLIASASSHKSIPSGLGRLVLALREGARTFAMTLREPDRGHTPSGRPCSDLAAGCCAPRWCGESAAA